MLIAGDTFRAGAIEQLNIWANRTYEGKRLSAGIILNEAESLSNRIGIMTKGKLIAIGTAKELMKKTNTQKFEDAFVEIVQRGE